MKRFAALAALLLTATAAQAATPYELYAQGKYDAAIAAGRAEKNASGYAIAARAELAAEAMRDAPCLECLQRAQNDARKAIAADPKQPDGHTFLAVALGYEARLIGKAEAGVRLYPSRAKAELDAALADDPNNSWALAALGGWNVEAVRGGGERLASWVYGASIDNAQEDFRKAFAAAPGNIPLRYQYALSLSGYDPVAFRSDIESTLAHIETMKPATAYDAFAQARAHDLRMVLKRSNASHYAALVRKYQGYP